MSDRGISGKVVTRAFVGSVMRYVISLAGGQEVQVQPSVRSGYLPNIGDDVALSVERSHWMVFPAEQAS